MSAEHLLKTAQTLRQRYQLVDSADREGKITALRELLAAVDAGDDIRLRRLGADIRGEVLQSEYYMSDHPGQLALAKEIVALYGGDGDPCLRSRTAVAEGYLVWFESDRPAAFLAAARAFIEKYIGDDDEETAYRVLTVAHAVIDRIGVDRPGVFDGLSALPADPSDRAEALALCETMVKRYGGEKSDRIRDVLAYVEDQRRDLTGDPAEMRAYAYKELDRLLANSERNPDVRPGQFPPRSDCFPGLAFSLLARLARAEGRRAFDVVHEWCAEALRRPLSPGLAAMVRTFGNFAISGRETPDEAALQSEYDAAAELVALYADSDDPRALDEAARALMLLLGTEARPQLAPYVDVLLARRDLLPVGTVASLMSYKIHAVETVEEKLSWNDAILALPLENSTFGAGDRARALARKAELLNDPVLRRETFHQMIARGARPSELSAECRRLLEEEDDPKERGHLLELAANACRDACRTLNECSETQYFIQLLTRRADGMRDAPAALALYREALAAMERWDRQGHRWFIHLETLEGMLCLTPDLEEKAALYDRFIELARVAGRHSFSTADELRLQKAALVLDPAVREETFAAIVPSYAERRVDSRERIETLAEALRNWLADCAAAGRDVNDRDGAHPVYEGETAAEAREARLTAAIAEWDAYPSEDWRTRRRKRFTATGALWMAREMTDVEKRSALCRLVVDLYGGQFGSGSVAVTREMRTWLTSPAK